MAQMVLLDRGLFKSSSIYPPFCRLDLLNAIIVLPEYSFSDLIIILDIGSFRNEIGMSSALTIPGIELMDRNQPNLSKISLCRITGIINECLHNKKFRRLNLRI